MSRAALLLVLPVIFGCTKKDEPAADTSAMAPAAPAAVVPTTPMNLAGHWTVQVMPADKDTTLLTYTLDATADKTGWKMTLPGRPAMDLRILSMDNDSVVAESGPYKSALQKGIMVTTHTNFHMEGDKLVGTTISHYDTKGADSVRNLRNLGMKTQ